MPVDYVALFALLTTAQLRFVVVGGLAVVLHGIDRLTADVDVIVDLASDRLENAVNTVTDAGYRPMAPVDPRHLADSTKRSQWQRERGMQVFSFWDSTNTRPTVDVLLDSPVPFEQLWIDAKLVSIGDTPVRVASIAHLIALKARAGRPQDLADIERLRAKAQD
jgi:predicted nucleotidyltransferase